MPRTAKQAAKAWADAMRESPRFPTVLDAAKEAYVQGHITLEAYEQYVWDVLRTNPISYRFPSPPNPRPEVET